VHALDDGNLDWLNVSSFSSPLAASLASEALERFERYVRIDTQASRARTRSPSTAGQLELGRLLVAELAAIGLEDPTLDENGYVRATLGATSDGAGAVIGLLAHLDTSPDAPGRGVEPIVHPAYDGGRIELPRSDTVLDPESMPELAEKVGEDIVTSSGDTLLGADDKAGVAEIMTALSYLSAHPEAPRPTLRVAFTPDEEIGLGAELFDVASFGALCAYTIDGSTLGELQDETFTAAQATIRIRGVDLHPGFATGKLVNAARLAARVVAELPSATLTPESTSGREGFIHVYDISASPAEATVQMIVRDFEDDLLAEHLALLRRIAEQVVGEEPRASLEIDIKHQYPNMRRYLESLPEAVAAADRAIRDEGLIPVRNPIRGGTDGSRLSQMGLPTPNIFAGGHEFHSVREWISVQDMAAAAAVIVRLAAIWSEPQTPAPSKLEDPTASGP
jgi:tripeptide aminopeptidase